MANISTIPISTVIVTDHEPDDIAALLELDILIQSGHITVPSIVTMCNENKAWPREELARKICNILKINPKHYFYQNTDDVTDFVNEVGALPEGSIILYIASFQLLYKAWKQFPEVFNRVTIFAYGSANFRWALKTVDGAEFANMINNLKIYVTENFFSFGESENAFNKTTSPELMSYIDSAETPAMELLKDTIEKWNIYCASNFPLKLKYDDNKEYKNEYKAREDLAEFSDLPLNLEEFTEEDWELVKTHAAKDAKVEGVLTARVLTKVMQFRNGKMQPSMQFVSADIVTAVVMKNWIEHKIYEKTIWFPRRMLSYVFSTIKYYLGWVDYNDMWKPVKFTFNEKGFTQIKDDPNANSRIFNPMGGNKLITEFSRLILKDYQNFEKYKRFSSL